MSVVETFTTGASAVTVTASSIVRDPDSDPRGVLTHHQMHALAELHRRNLILTRESRSRPPGSATTW